MWPFLAADSKAWCIPKPPDLVALFVDASVGRPYRIQTSPWLAAGSRAQITNFTFGGPVVITDATAGTTLHQFLRAITPYSLTFPPKLPI